MECGFLCASDNRTKEPAANGRNVETSTAQKDQFELLETKRRKKNFSTFDPKAFYGLSQSYCATLYRTYRSDGDAHFASYFREH